MEDANKLKQKIDELTNLCFEYDLTFNLEIKNFFTDYDLKNYCQINKTLRYTLDICKNNSLNTFKFYESNESALHCVNQAVDELSETLPLIKIWLD